jgi:hypothetical protein
VAGQVELLQVGVSPVHKKMVQMVGHWRVQGRTACKERSFRVGNILKRKDNASGKVSGTWRRRCIWRQWIERDFVSVCEGWKGHGLDVPPGIYPRRQHIQRLCSILAIGSHMIGYKEIIGRHWERNVGLQEGRFWQRLSCRNCSWIFFRVRLSKDSRWGRHLFNKGDFESANYCRWLLERRI